ncbi:transcription initiation protein [Gemmatimonas aurantiaca]|nr:transcription initiation protein [Gemmatimonas aurantiaca]
MSNYLLLIRDDGCAETSPADIQSIIQEFSTWAGELSASGKLKDAAKLADGGAIVQSSNDIITDGPFTETKDTVGGFFLIEAESLDAAIAIARKCPGLKYGSSVEVRPIDA